MNADLTEQLVSAIVRQCGFTPTPGQGRAIALLAPFILSSAPDRAFILCGYAGTGKTSVVSATVRAMRTFRRRVVLLAPTGRAAKVFSLYSGSPAYTIHKKIYRQKSILDQTTFTLDRNLHEETLFIVDEASMISNDGISGSFGSGRLLDDLVRYVRSGKSCSLLLLGDTAQLPPVGQPVSPALDPATLGNYGLSITGFTLTEVVRQDSRSGILHNATLLRDAIRAAGSSAVTLPAFRLTLSGYPDIIRISGSSLIDTISECYSRSGQSDTIVICRSNRRAVLYNNGIRNTILDREDELCRGDRLMIVRNNYYWTERELARALEENLDSVCIPPFIANGDMAVVRRIRNIRQLYGFRFATVTLAFPDYDDFELDATVLLDTLHTDSPALTREQSDTLCRRVLEDYCDIGGRKQQMEALRTDQHFNALQVKYAYAVTCHKAQGGQWSNIIIDRGTAFGEGLDADYYRWLYTALTRATERVFLVNWPDSEVISPRP